MANAWERLGRQVGILKRLTSGRLSVAVVSTAKYFVPRLLGSFCEQHPSIDIALQVLSRNGVVQRLRKNCDEPSVLSQSPADMDSQDQPLLDNPLHLVAPTGPHLTRRQRVALKALSRERFILRKRGSGTRLATKRHFATASFTPALTLELGSNEALKEALAGHLGIGIVSRPAL